MSKPVPESSPIAFLSDIHGNLRALDAVLEELQRRVIERIYVAGDHLLGGDDPVGVYKRLMQVNAICTRGPGDAALVQIDPDALSPDGDEQREAARRFKETRRALGDLALKFLERLPETRRIPLVDGSEILMVHGSPADPSVEISDDLSDEEMVELLADDPADIVVCGASHVPFTRELPEARVIGLGSVGQAPDGSVAFYTVVSPRMDGTLIEQSWVDL
ncbi:MAG: metallophosphoesterase [Sandaracinaceae bacterium]